MKITLASPLSVSALALMAGGRLTLTGAGLHVSSLQLDEGRVLVDGAIDGVQYDGAGPVRRGGFLRRALG